MSTLRPDLDELLRFIVGEGLDATRRREIAQALLADPALRANHDTLAAALAAAARQRVEVEPNAGFEQRLWERIAPQLPAAAAVPKERNPLGGARSLAWAAVILAGIGLAWGLRDAGPPEAAPSGRQMTWLADDAATRILERQLAQHFEAAASVLDGTDEATDARSARAAALVQRNRLYELAASRGQREAEARLLRRLAGPLDQLAVGETTTASGDPLDQLAFQARGFALRSRQGHPPSNTTRSG
jgi:hypothetical protein